VRELRGRGADIVVVVAHIGGVQNEDGSIRGAVLELARDGVDAVVGGHTHTFVAGTLPRVSGEKSSDAAGKDSGGAGKSSDAAGKTDDAAKKSAGAQSGGVPVVIAGSSGRALGRIVLQWDGRRVLSATSDLVRAYSDSMQVPNWDPIAALVDSMREVTRPLTERVLGQAARPLRRAALANLVTDAMRSAVHANVAIGNPGGLRRDLNAGPITVGDVFELMPFDNALVTVRLTGAGLRAVVASRPEKSLLSGLRGRWDPQAPAEARLTLVHQDGSPLRDDSTYVVVTNSFIAQGGDDFRGFDAGQELTMTPILVRDAITQAIESATRAGRSIDVDEEPRLVLPERGRD
jgi:2',3'-cyclic-nucleotide 2'-phosphodiesterase/3'-nucleotidase